MTNFTFLKKVGLLPRFFKDIDDGDLEPLEIEGVHTDNWALVYGTIFNTTPDTTPYEDMATFLSQEHTESIHTYLFYEEVLHIIRTTFDETNPFERGICEKLIKAITERSHQVRIQM